MTHEEWRAFLSSMLEIKHIAAEFNGAKYNKWIQSEALKV